jgi:hypothetical protein
MIRAKTRENAVIPAKTCGRSCSVLRQNVIKLYQG